MPGPSHRGNELQELTVALPLLVAPGPHGHPHMERGVATRPPHVAGAAVQRVDAADAADARVPAAPLGVLPPVPAAPARPHAAVDVARGPPQAGPRGRAPNPESGEQVRRLQRPLGPERGAPAVLEPLVAGRQRQAAGLGEQRRRLRLAEPEREPQPLAQPLRLGRPVAAHVEAALREQDGQPRR